MKHRPTACKKGPAAKRRQETRPARPNERCSGYGDEPRIFSTQKIGAAARAHPDRPSGPRCAFSSAENMRRCLGNARGKGQMTAALAFYEEQNVNIHSLVCSRISALNSEEALDACLQRLRRFQKKGASD